MNRIIETILLSCFIFCLSYAVYDIFLKGFFPSSETSQVMEVPASKSVYSNGAKEEAGGSNSNYDNQSEGSSQPNSTESSNTVKENIESDIKNFDNKFKKISTVYIDSKEKFTRIGDQEGLKSLAVLYRSEMKSLILEIKNYFETNKQYITNPLKRDLEYTLNLCEVQVEQAERDGGLGIYAPIN